jgi:hypothetical protein
VLFIRRARLEGRSPPLLRLYYQDLDAMGTEWIDEEGEIEGFVTGIDTGKFRPYRIPSEAGTVHLTVVRLPLENMILEPETPEEDDHFEPEIAEAYHEKLIDWMEYRHYRTRDADVENPKAAAEALARFEEEFGPASRAIDEAWIARNHGFIEDEGLF